MKTLHYLLYEVTIKGENSFKLAVYRERQEIAQKAGKLFGEPYPDWERTVQLVAVPSELGADMVDVAAKTALAGAVGYNLSRAFVETVDFKSEVSVVVTSEEELNALPRPMVPVNQIVCCHARNLAHGAICRLPVNHSGMHDDGAGAKWNDRPEELKERLETMAEETPVLEKRAVGACCYTQTPVITHCQRLNNGKGNRCQRPYGHLGIHDDFLGNVWEACPNVRKDGAVCCLNKGHAGLHDGGSCGQWLDAEGVNVVEQPATVCNHVYSVSMGGPMCTLPLGHPGQHQNGGSVWEDDGLCTHQLSGYTCKLKRGHPTCHGDGQGRYWRDNDTNVTNTAVRS